MVEIESPVEAYIKEKYPDDEIIVTDGFDNAFIGVGFSFRRAFACYDKERVIEILSEDMPREEAEEYFDFNIGGAYVGENTPVFIERWER